MNIKERELVEEKMQISGKNDFSEWARQQLTGDDQNHLRANPRDVLKELADLNKVSVSIADKFDRILEHIGKKERTNDPGGLQGELTELIREYVTVKSEMVLAVQKLYRS